MFSVYNSDEHYNARYEKSNVEPFAWRTFVVHFCGKSYLGVEIKVTTYNREEGRNVDNKRFCYSDEDIVHALTDLKLPKVLARYQERDKYARYGRLGSFTLSRRYDYLPAKEDVDRLNPTPLLLQHKVPIIVGVPDMWSVNKNIYKEIPVENRPYNLILNAKLKDFGFEKVMHPYLAFQEIDQFMATHLNSQAKEMVEIKDIDMIAKKGFDKFSFRKGKTKKPWK